LKMSFASAPVGSNSSCVSSTRKPPGVS
jgi:hypothetical protein